MQLGAQEKWQETKEKTEREHARKREWAGKDLSPVEVYKSPRAANRGGDKMDGARKVLEEVGVETESVSDVGSAKGVITALERNGGGKESEKARRVAAARERRNKRQ